MPRYVHDPRSGALTIDPASIGDDFRNPDNPSEIDWEGLAGLGFARALPFKEDAREAHRKANEGMVGVEVERKSLEALKAQMQADFEAKIPGMLAAAVADAVAKALKAHGITVKTEKKPKGNKNAKPKGPAAPLPKVPAAVVPAGSAQGA